LEFPAKHFLAEKLSQNYPTCIKSDNKTKNLDEFYRRICSQLKFLAQRIGTRFDCGNEYILLVELFKEKSQMPFVRKAVTVETFPGGPCLWKKVSIDTKQTISSRISYNI
jgi:hypothetical protein